MKNSTETKTEVKLPMKPLRRVMFERAPVLADIAAFYCLKPGCTCKNVTLTFFYANGQFNSKLFKLEFNYETWDLESSEVFKDNMDYTVLIEEFMSSFDDRLKFAILSGVAGKTAADKTSNEPSLRNDINLSKLDIGSMVYYSEIYHAEPLIFEHNGKDYSVVDHYCPKPKCDCKDVTLTFYSLDEGVVNEPILTYNIKFATKKETIEEKDADITARFAKELYIGLSKTIDGSTISFFENRYKKIKEWGEGYFKIDAPAKISTPKPARNAPCPCGSGKKYKKCCG